jgi:hypothetical protein
MTGKPLEIGVWGHDPANRRLKLRSIHDRTGISSPGRLRIAAFRNALPKNAVATLILSRGGANRCLIARAIRRHR